MSATHMPASRTLGRDIYFTNLPALVPGGFQPAPAVGKGWISFDYELTGLPGVGLCTGALSPAGELTLDLGLTGWHTLHFCHSPTLCVWLDGDPGERDLPGPQAGSALRDFPLHAADLTGRALHLAPRRGTHPSEAMLFYIRAEPVAGPPQRHRNLVVTEDGHGVFWMGMDRLRDLYRFLLPYRDSDVFRVLWGVFGGGDVSADPASRVATPLPPSLDHAYYASEKTFIDTIARLQKEGNILASVVRFAHAEGLEIHFYFRVGMGGSPFPHHGGGTRFYTENPGLRCRDEFGREVMRLSYAYPQVQDHMLAYFEELLAYEPDGICLAFNRGLPMMVCEEPVLEAFRRRHGRAPKLPDEVDSDELLAVRHELLAGFVERLHKLLAARGKALSCIAPRNFHENRLRGLDLELLLRRGLLESVMIGAGHEDNPLYTARTHQPPVDQDDLEPVKRLKAIGTAKVFLGGCAGHGTFWPPNDPATRMRRARRNLEEGLDGSYIWDVNQWWARDWEHVRRYGDLAHLQAALAGTLPTPIRRETLRIHDLVVNRYSPWNAH